MESEKVAARIEREDAYLIPYLLGWADLAEDHPWGAAHSFALEVGRGYGLIRSEINSTPTELGKAVAKILSARSTATKGEG